MNRRIAILLGLALAAAPVHVPALHVHTYIDHDHPEHHHGPAAHEHDGGGAHRAEEETVRLESCDPGRHTIGFLFVCGTATQAHCIDAEIVSPWVALPDFASRMAVHLTDVRVHGPPQRTQASPRAPPLISA